MTINLEDMKRLAADLAGDVLAQIERDGSINRENIAAQLLSGLVLDAGQKLLDRPKSNAGPTCRTFDELTPPVRYTMRNRVAPPGAAVHIICECNECKRRRSHSLCGCEMCEHHTSAKAQAAAPIGGLQALVGTWAGVDGPFHIPGLGMPEACEVEPISPRIGYTTLKWRGLRVWLRNDMPAISPARIRYIFDHLITARHKGKPQCASVDMDLVILPDGELITGLEAMQRGLK